MAQTRDYIRDLRSTYTRIADQYLAIRDEMLLVRELEAFINLLKGPRVLDAGCGPGRDVRFFLEDGLEATGIDLTKRFISLAQQRVNGANFQVMNVLDLKFANESFDGIWCCAVLSHLKKTDLQIALSEFHRVLKDKGVLFVSVKAGLGETVVREALFDYQPRFTSFFEEGEIRQYLQQANFSPYTTYTFNERERFGPEYRDLDYIVTFSVKMQKPKLR